MSKRRQSVVIGGFVLGALVLALGGLVAFGSGLFQKDTKEIAIARFDGSVSGLSHRGRRHLPGALRIGQVPQRSATTDPRHLCRAHPVERHGNRPRQVSFDGPASQTIAENARCRR